MRLDGDRRAPLGSIEPFSLFLIHLAWIRESWLSLAFLTVFPRKSFFCKHLAVLENCKLILFDFMADVAAFWTFRLNLTFSVWYDHRYRLRVVVVVRIVVACSFRIRFVARWRRA